MYTKYYVIVTLVGTTVAYPFIYSGDAFKKNDILITIFYSFQNNNEKSNFNINPNILPIFFLLKNVVCLLHLLHISKCTPEFYFLRIGTGSAVVECLTRDRGAAGLSLTGVIALCPCARHINPSLVLVQPRKTHPYITERLLMGRKESNQINWKQTLYSDIGVHIFCNIGYQSTSADDKSRRQLSWMTREKG